MRRLLSVMSAIAVLSGLEFYYVNFIVPKRDIAKATVEVQSAVIDIGGTMPDHVVYILKKKKYVWIDQKWYHFNPEHVYMIEGTPTLFIKSRPNRENKSADAGTLVWDHAVISDLNKMLTDNPLKVYTPAGMKTLVDAAKAAQKMAGTQTSEIDSQTQ